MVAPAKAFPFGQEIKFSLPSMYGKLTTSELSDSNTKWSPIKAEALGIVNLTRIYGLKENDARRQAACYQTSRCGIELRCKDNISTFREVKKDILGRR